MKGSCIVIPKRIRPTILSQLHCAHQGIEKTKLHARTAVYWPGIYTEIENLVKSCEICQEDQAELRREPMIPSEIPPRAWHTIGADLFYLKGKEYLLISDYYSKFPFLRHMTSNCTSTAVINQMKQVFSEQGIPQVVRTDNGPQFSSKEFRDFATAYGFQHVTSSPHYPRSNGFIESQVKVVKRTLEKVSRDHGDPYLAMLFLRSTPIDNHLPSPAQLLQNRSFHDTLPKISVGIDEDVTASLQMRQDKQKIAYDHHTKALKPLTPGQQVSVLNPSSHSWQPATVNRVCDEPRSYSLVTAAGSEIRRNRAQIQTRVEPPSLDQPTMTTTENPVLTPKEAPLPRDIEERSMAKTPAERTTRSGRVTKSPQRLDL